MFPESSGASLGEVFDLPTFRIIGDSTVSQCDSLSIPVASTSTSARNAALSRNPRWWTWVHWLTGGAFNYVTMMDYADFLRKGSNSGMGGDDMEELLARIPAILATAPEDYFVFAVGTNDMNAGIALSVLQSRIIALINATINAGKKPIMTTVTPRNGVDNSGGNFDWGATITTAAQKRLTLASYNDWLVRYCRERGIICVAWHHVMQDSAGVAITGYTNDGLHPSPRGGYYQALEFIRQIGSLIPKSARGQLLVNDVYDATYNVNGNPLNGALTGTGGTTSNAGGTGTITGTVPDSWRVNKVTSTTTSCATAIVSRSDGNLGNMIEFTWTSAGTGSASEDWRFEYFAAASLNLTSYANAGDLLMMEFDCEVVAGHGGVLKAVQGRISGNNVSKTGTTVSFDAATQQIRDSANGFGSFVAGRMVNVSNVVDPQTPATNRGNFFVESASAGVLQLRSNAGLTNEAAGTNLVVTMPYITAVGGASSTENMPDANTGIFTVTTPISPQIATQSLNGVRIGFTINGTIADTAIVRLGRIKLIKLPFRPALSNYTATDV
jgi:lysophospholipase L1-like esterase